MKKNFLIISLLFIVLIGFAGCKDTEIGLYGIETAAFTLGYFAAQQPDSDLALRSIYDLAVEGKMTPEAVNRILLRLDTHDPFELAMINRSLRLAELAGAQVIEGKITDVSGIPPEVINAIARGYKDGYNVFTLSEARKNNEQG